MSTPINNRATHINTIRYNEFRSKWIRPLSLSLFRLDFIQCKLFHKSQYNFSKTHFAFLLLNARWCSIESKVGLFVSMLLKMCFFFLLKFESIHLF